MFITPNILLVQQLQADRQQEIMTQLRLDGLFAEQRKNRRETMKRLLGLLRPIAVTKLTGRNMRHIVVRGA